MSASSAKFVMEGITTTTRLTSLPPSGSLAVGLSGGGGGSSARSGKFSSSTSGASKRGQGSSPTFLERKTVISRSGGYDGEWETTPRATPRHPQPHPNTQSHTPTSTVTPLTPRATPRHP
ncbi:collagen alpha-1(XVII) chain-like isoform X2 [Arapaima gigas]